MAVNINVSAEDWQATAAEFAGENMRLRAALQAASRELNRLASEVNGEGVDEEAGPPTDDDPNDIDERKE
jgi:uncharacterized protein YukE